MNSLFYAPQFKRKAKPLIKKYHTLKANIDCLAVDLIKNPYIGESYGSGIYKIRLADESKGKGKSGGFRVMYYCVTENEDSIKVTLITIFDKNELDTIKKKDAEKILKEALDEM